MRSFQTYLILTFVLLCTVTDGRETQSLPDVSVRVKASNFLEMCRTAHTECLKTKNEMQCTTCKVACHASLLPEKAEECVRASSKRHKRRCALTSSQWDQVKSELRFAVKTEEETDHLPSVVGRWSPNTCAETETPCARCCEHEYYWCHRGGFSNKCRHCVAAVAVCSNVSSKVRVFNSNLTGRKRAAIALARLDRGICQCVSGFYC